MRLNSLSFRLTASAGAIALIMLVSAGLLLANLFRLTVERNFDARLEAVMDGLLANVEIQNPDVPGLSGSIADTRFTIPFSGWYWQVSPPTSPQARVLTSPSLLDQILVPEDHMYQRRDGNGIAHFSLMDGRGTRLRAIEQRYRLFGNPQEYSFLVAGNFDELRAEISAFNNALTLMLAVLAAGLILAILWQVRFGLKPMRELEAELNAIREGQQERLKKNYPEEIDAVARELNLLMKDNSEVIERARTQVGNLAHALKTPLSVLANEAGEHENSLAQKVREQTSIMRDSVNLYLDRARRAARARALGSATDVRPILDGLLRTLAKINRSKEYQYQLECDANLQFRGERQDFEEIAGNILENAFKWAEARVLVRVRTQRDEQNRPWLIFQVQDDGPGVKPEAFSTILERGKRLDETKPGSGLGLSIVSETVSMYSGDVNLAPSSLGGLQVSIRLPAALNS